MNKVLIYSGILALSMAVGFASTSEARHHGKHGGKFLERVDTDGDGSVSRAEFDAHHDKKFTRMDKDGNGTITKEEIDAHRDEMRAKRKEKREGKGKPESKPGVIEDSSENE